MSKYKTKYPIRLNVLLPANFEVDKSLFDRIEGIQKSAFVEVEEPKRKANK